MVASQSFIASRVGTDVLRDGGNAVDAAVATAFALAVVHPTAGNIGGGGFLVNRLANGTSATYDFRETAPALANPQMFLKDGKYDAELHHNSHVAVGVPGTVAGLYAAWADLGSKKMPWRRLVEPAVGLARGPGRANRSVRRNRRQRGQRRQQWQHFPAVAMPQLAITNHHFVRHTSFRLSTGALTRNSRRRPTAAP